MVIPLQGSAYRAAFRMGLIVALLIGALWPLQAIEATKANVVHNWASGALISEAVPPMITTETLSPAEREIIQAESGGDVHAKNGQYFGIWQGSTSNRLHYSKLCATSPTTLNYDDQLCMMRLYIQDTYGTAEHALDMRNSRTPRWY